MLELGDPTGSVLDAPATRMRPGMPWTVAMYARVSMAAGISLMLWSLNRSCSSSACLFTRWPAAQLWQVSAAP